MSDTPSTSCKITNDSGGTIVVLNAFNSSTNVSANSTKQGYMQELESLPVKGGTSTTIATGASGTVTLDQTYVDSKGKTRQAFIYDLLISKPDSLFPVMTVGESLDFDTMAYPDIDVTAAAAANMKKALVFCQNIMTAPSSKMATAFQTAMTDAFKKSTIAESEQAIADFFNQYDAFKGLDFPSYVAVSTWMRSFAFLWGMDDKGQPGQKYWVYSAPPEGQKGTTSEGTITITKKSDAPSPADPKDHNSGFDIEYAPASGSSTALTFDNGQLIDSPGGAIALNGSFGYRGTFSGKTGDTTAITIFTGTLSATKVIAIPIAPESGWDKFWGSLSFSKLLGYFLQAMGLWMALDFLKQKLTAKDKKLEDDKANDNKGKDPDAQQQKDAQQAGDDVGQQAAADDQALADNAAGKGNVEVPGDQAAFDGAVDKVRADGAEAYNEVAGDNISGGIDEAKAQLDDLSEIEVNSDIEEAESNLIDAKESLADGDLSGANSSLGDVTEALPDIVDGLGDKVSAELKEEVKESVEVQEEASDVAEKTGDNADSTETGDETPFEGGDVPIE